MLSPTKLWMWLAKNIPSRDKNTILTTKSAKHQPQNNLYNPIAHQNPVSASQ